MIVILASKDGKRPDHFSHMTEMPSAPPMTPRAYGLAISIFTGCLMAVPDKPKINDIDNEVGAAFGVSGRAMRFDRAELFNDLEIWKREPDPALWAASAPMRLVGLNVLYSAWVRGQMAGLVPADIKATGLVISDDALQAAGLAAVALAYGCADSGFEVNAWDQLMTNNATGWTLAVHKDQRQHYELALSFRSFEKIAQGDKLVEALTIAQSWLKTFDLPRISTLFSAVFETTPANPSSASESSKPTDYREAARIILAELAELCNGWALPYIDKNRHGLTVYHDAEMLRSSFDVIHHPFDVAGSTITNLYHLRLIDENGVGREPIGVPVENGAADLLAAYHQACDADSVADRIKAASDFLDKMDDSAPPLTPSGSPDIAALNAAAAAEWAARDEAAGIDNTASKTLANAAAQAAAGINPTPKQDDSTMSKKTPDTKTEASATNPFKTPPNPKPTAPPEAKPKNMMGERTSGMGDPLELKNPTSPDKAAEEADAEKIKKLKEAHRAIVHKARPELTAGLVSFGGDVETIVIGPIVQGYTEEGLQRTGKLTLTLRPAYKDVTSRALQKWLTVYREFDGRAAELVDRLADDLAAVVKYDRVKVDFSHVEDGLPLKATAKRGYDSPD